MRAVPAAPSAPAPAKLSEAVAADAGDALAPVSDRRENEVVGVAADVTGQAPAPLSTDDGTPAFDEAGESAFLAESRQRGEPLVAAKAKQEIAEETDSKALPSLNELVNRIPPEVREALEDLFRARFVSVRRVPKKALK